MFAFLFYTAKLFASYPCMADVYAGKAVVFRILNKESVHSVCAFDDDVVGIIATSERFVADDSSLVPVDAVLGMIENEVYAVFASGVQDIRAVEISNLRISCDLCNVRFKRLAPCLALVLADEAGEIILVIDIVAVENKAAVGTENEVAVGVSHSVEGKLGKHAEGLAAIVADDDLIEKSFFVAGESLVGGIAEFKNVYPAVAVYGVIYTSALVVNLNRLRPGYTVVVAEKAHRRTVWFEIAACVAQAEEHDGTVVADNSLFATDELITVEKRIVAVLENRRLAPGDTAIGRTLIFHPTVHGVTCVYATLVARTVGIETDNASVLAFDHCVTEVSAAGFCRMVDKKFFFFDYNARIAFG